MIKYTDLPGFYSPVIVEKGDIEYGLNSDEAKELQDKMRETTALLNGHKQKLSLQQLNIDDLEKENIELVASIKEYAMIHEEMLNELAELKAKPLSKWKKLFTIPNWID